MPQLEPFVIVALISLLVGLVAGIFLGSRLTRSHYLFMARMMMQPRQAPPPPQQRPRPRTRQLYRDEQDYY